MILPGEEGHVEQEVSDGPAPSWGSQASSSDSSSSSSSGHQPGGDSSSEGSITDSFDMGLGDIRPDSLAGIVKQNQPCSSLSVFLLYLLVFLSIYSVSLTVFLPASHELILVPSTYMYCIYPAIALSLSFFPTYLISLAFSIFLLLTLFSFRIHLYTIIILNINRENT